VPLRSGTLEIDVIAPEAGWAATQLADAVAVLERGDPPQPRIGQIYDANAVRAIDDEAAHAGRVLRFLETAEAARAMVRFFEHGPRAAQQELRAGLFGSPWRKEVTAAMDEATAAPDRAVTSYFLGTRIEFEMIARLEPAPLDTSKSPEEMRAWIVSQMPYQERAKAIS